MPAARRLRHLAGNPLPMLPARAPMRAGVPPRGALLTGRVKPAAILGIGPGWGHEYDACPPAAAGLAAIAGAPRGATIEVHSGSRCDDSRVAVPHFIKVLDRTGSHRLKGGEIGRIIQTPETTLEHDPANLVLRAFPLAP